jgi:mannose-6-phosphate isomerase-like protein (cupin superfamily)
MKASLMTLALMTLAALLAAPVGVARAQEGDGKVTYIGSNEVKAAFAKGVPMVEVGDYKIHASRRESPGKAEVHTRDTDIAYVLQGSATLVTGGTAIDLESTGPEELRGSGIQGGNTRELQPGDVVIIPNGIPHWFKNVSAPFLYYVVKVRQAKRQVAMETAR